MRNYKRIASLMAAILFLQTPFTAISSYASISHMMRERPVASVETSSNAAKEVAMMSAVGIATNSGNLKIEILGVVTGKDARWNAELTALDDDEDVLTGVYTEPIELPASTDASYTSASVIFTEIPVGSYRLRLVPENAGYGSDTSYVTYDQGTIKIKNNVTTIRLINGDPAAYGYEKDSDKYGVLMMGDINGDEEIDENDLAKLTQFVADGETLTDNVFYERADLNGDGSVDLLDVSLFAKYYKSGMEKHLAKLSTSPLILKSEIIVVESDSNATPTSGSLEDTFSGSSDIPLTVEVENEISEHTPAVIATEFTTPKEMNGLVINPVIGSENSIIDGQVTVTDEDGKEYAFDVVDGKVTKANVGTQKVMLIAAIAEEDTATQAVPIVIDLGGQVAVKKVTIKVTKTLAENPTLVDISKVEFYDDMESRISEPLLSIPEKLAVENGDAQFALTWKKMPNVTGYYVTVTGSDLNGEKGTDTYEVETNHIIVDALKFVNGKLANGNTYTVSVRSVNGSWKSDAVTIEAKPEALSTPPAPENIVIDAGYKRLSIRWKKMKDTASYNLYYRETENAAAGTFTVINDIEDTSCSLTDLKDDTEYEIWLTGKNPKGIGPQSLHYKARTTTLNPPVTPNYKLINIADSGKSLTRHVTGAVYGKTNMDAVVDGDYATAWVRDDWDAGYEYPAENKSPIVTFDSKYEMDTIVLIPDEEQPYSLTAGRIYYWDANGNRRETATRMTQKTSNGKNYYVFQAKEPFASDKVQIAMTTGYGRRISIAELKFYYYDEIEADIMNLYADLYHISLKENVTLADINKLRERLAVPDSVSKELHPKKAELEAELDNAEQILNEGSRQTGIMIVDNKDTQKSDGHITFRGGLNTYQPLGVTALAGDSLTVYVGGPDVRDGDATRLELIVSQYHGSTTAVFKSLGYLTAGANEIIIPALDKMDLERGGQLYIDYTGNSGAEEYGVRVIGGRKSSVLDLSDETDHDKKVELALAYLIDLKEQAENVENCHDEDHAQHAYEPQNCVYQATDIVTKYAMFSTAASQVLAGLGEVTGSDSDETLAEQLVNTAEAMDRMLTLFYQHKGLNDTTDTAVTNRMPVSRINIRYQRMFAGAFMYAGGKHIGVEWPELKGLMGSTPVTADANGKYQSGNYFGWGIAHEIGHEINESAYATAEVTNNFYSLLAQAEQSEDFNEDVRFKYDDVFKKVTSGTKGKPGNVFTQLAMYWQLHLAYDTDGYNYKLYDSSKKQFASLVMARMDSIVRNPSTAPQTEIKLELSSGDKDNKLMRLAMAATEKDLLEFFKCYGLEPDFITTEYAKQFAKETRGIWFANDNKRAEQIEAGSYENLAAKTKVVGEIDYETGSNKVSLSLDSDENIWAYEIYRIERIQGDTNCRPVGYAYADRNGHAEFTDVIGTVNNRAFSYVAVGYDLWLNPTETEPEKAEEIGSVKVSYDGELDKSLWTISSNLTNEELEDPGEFHPDTTVQPGLENMIDNDDMTSFTGSTASETVPEIIISFNSEETVTGIKYQANSEKGRLAFKAFVSMDGTAWTAANMKSEKTDGDRKTVYFDDGTNLYTYDAAYLKLTAEGMAGTEITISELSVLGQTGDNVELMKDGIGILATDYKNDRGETLLEKGSLIFTGTYKGNPSYNTVLLWDKNGNIVGGVDDEEIIHAEQIIFAPDAGEGKFGEISEGFWVYYIEPAYVEGAKANLGGGAVRAELYRVDNAMTQEGERIVSSTVFVDFPTELSSITLN